MAYYYAEDCKVLFNELNFEDSRLRLKRRWLMNSALSRSEQTKVKKLDLLSDKSIPESLLRKDDAYYDTIKNFVTGVSGKEHEHALCLEKLFKNGMRSKNLPNVLKGMSHEELCYLSELVTEGSVKFKKTKLIMARIINTHFPSYLYRKIIDLDKRKDQSSSLPENPQYLSSIREDLCSSSESFRDSAMWVLDMLEELPVQALLAMHRRLKGKKGLIKPMLFDLNKCQTKTGLVSPIRIHCMKMLSELDEGNPPPEALVEALSVAGVTFKLLRGHSHITEFKRFSPEVKDLQSRIAKAIHTVNSDNASLFEVIIKKLNHETIVFKKPHVALRNWLIEHLVECIDMESIPKGFVEILNDINDMAETSKDINKAPCSSSSGSTSRKEVEEEVEFLLCFSAQIKQVMLDLLPEDEDVDQDFATAYMEEEPEENDEEEDYTNEFDSSECSSVTESMGETKPDQSPVSTPKQEPLDFDQETDSFRSNGFSSFSHRNQSFSRNRPLSATFEDLKNEAKPDDPEFKTNRKDKRRRLQGQHQQCTTKNKYLSIQRACDETAMAMHRAIDGILNELRKS